MKHTKAECEASGNGVFKKGQSTNIATITPCGNRYETEDNAKLIAEAFTVAFETGKTPRQLADENKELLEALRTARVVILSAKREEAFRIYGANEPYKAETWAETHIDIVSIENLIKKATS